MVINVNKFKVRFSDNVLLEDKEKLVDALIEGEFDKSINICNNRKISYSYYRPKIHGDAILSSYGDLYLPCFEVLVPFGDFDKCIDDIFKIVNDKQIIIKEKKTIFYLFLNDEKAWKQVKHDKDIRAIVKAHVSRMLECDFAAFPNETYDL